MSYQYPLIGASTPEETSPVPAITYSFWVVSRISNVIDQVLDRDPGAGTTLEPFGNLRIEGRKFSVIDEVINPTGETTSITLSRLYDFLSANPEFAAGYNAFVQACGILLDVVETEQIVQAAVGGAFNASLVKLRSAYQAMDRDDDAAIVTLCIQKYPGEWDKAECLARLQIAFAHTSPGLAAPV